MADSPEESSWTFYIDGFICDNNKSCFSSEIESPSLVSDAASCQVANKLLCNCNCNWTQGFSSAKNIQNSFKKQKTKIIPAVDCELEDTASSPVSSPKVSYMNVFTNRDDKKEKAKMDVSEVKRNSFGKVFAVERDKNYAELKKRSSTCGQED